MKIWQLTVALLAIILLSGCGADPAGEMASQPPDELPDNSTEFEGGSSENEFADAADSEYGDEAHMEVANDDGGNDTSHESPLAPQTSSVPPIKPRVGTSAAVPMSSGAAANETASSSTIRSFDPNETQMSSDVTGSTGPFDRLPAGATHDPELGYATIQVYYATDRQVSDQSLASHQISGNRDAFVMLCGLAIVFALLGLKNVIQKRKSLAITWAVISGASLAGLAFLVFSGSANIEKHGVTYTADRGSLVRGICQVTVPDVHDRGQVERPSLLRFEVREDQKKHIVLTQAVELSAGDFYRRMEDTLVQSPDRDLLVFIHGYNVDFQSAITRTAQIAVDLPFEGVPVCYSWPSQGTLFGYTVDETNAAWTQTHLKQFLTELVQQGGANAINVIAHSMGNRPTSGAIVDMFQEGIGTNKDGKFLDRIVLAAPDVDADRFRRDLAPGLSDAAQLVTLYASSDDQALVASKKVHGHPRAGESGENMVVVSGIETIDVSGIDLSLLGHSYYGDNASMLQDLYDLVRVRLPAIRRKALRPKSFGELTYWKLTQSQRHASSPRSKSADR